MSYVRVSSHVFIPAASHLLTKTDVLTAVYIIRGLILVRFSHLQKTYNLHSDLQLIFDSLFCSSGWYLKSTRITVHTSIQCVCVYVCACSVYCIRNGRNWTVLNVATVSFSETFYQTTLHHVPGDTLQLSETWFLKRMRVRMSCVNCLWTQV